MDTSGLRNDDSNKNEGLILRIAGRSASGIKFYGYSHFHNMFFNDDDDDDAQPGQAMNKSYVQYVLLILKVTITMKRTRHYRLFHYLCKVSNILDKRRFRKWLKFPKDRFCGKLSKCTCNN
jgi:hypothetical protein